jgi:hypothetical protein
MRKCVIALVGLVLATSACGRVSTSSTATADGPLATLYAQMPLTVASRLETDVVDLTRLEREAAATKPSESRASLTAYFETVGEVFVPLVMSGEIVAKWKPVLGVAPGGYARSVSAGYLTILEGVDSASVRTTLRANAAFGKRLTEQGGVFTWGRPTDYIDLLDHANEQPESDKTFIIAPFAPGRVAIGRDPDDLQPLGQGFGKGGKTLSQYPVGVDLARRADAEGAYMVAVIGLEPPPSELEDGAHGTNFPVKGAALAYVRKGGQRFALIIYAHTTSPIAQNHAAKYREYLDTQTTYAGREVAEEFISHSVTTDGAYMTVRLELKHESLIPRLLLQREPII